MISAFGYLINATTPAAFIAAPLALGLLVYVFRRNGTTREAVVSSLYLLARLPKRLPARRRFVPPLQFWLELFAFLFLTAAASGLFARYTGRHVAIVIDTSMSMALVDRTRATNVEAAVSSALTDISSGSSKTRYSLFSLDDRLTRLTSTRVDAGQARPILTALRANPAIDRITSQLVPLLTDSDYDAVWIYTDHPLRDPVPQQNVRVVSVYNDQTAGTLTNLWFSGVATNEKDGVTMLAATVQVASSEPQRVKVWAKCTDAESGTSAPLPERTAQVEPRSATTLEIPLSNSGWSFCELNASLENPGVSDSLPLDNTAWIARSEQSNKVLLVSELTPFELGLDKLTTISLAKADGDPPPDTAAIYHRKLPASPRRAPTLLIFPPPGPLPWGGSVIESAAQGIPVTRWLESHPIVQYVNIPLIVLPSMRRLECPTAATSILFAPEGEIGCAGESGGKRYAVIGMELLPFDGLKSPSLSILTLNAVKWLFTGHTSLLESASGMIEAPAGSTTAHMMTSTPTTLDLGKDGTVQVRAPGIIRFTTREGETSGYRVHNVFSNEESDLSAPREISLPALEAQDDGSREETTLPLYRWLAILALVILSLDLLRRLVTRAQWSLR